jgi:hypothetical protein
MIKLTLFNILTVELLNTKYLTRIIFDTSRVAFSFDLKLGLFYKILPWYNKSTEYDVVHNVDNNVLDIICPVLFDLRYYEQIDCGYDD